MNYEPFSESMRRGVLVLLLLTACSSSGPAPAASSQTQAASSPKQSPAAVRSDYYAIVGKPNAPLSVFGSDGSMAFQAPASQSTFQVHTMVSWLSATRKLVYYLDGSQVRFVGPGLLSGTATNIALGAYEQAGFSVSPDDQRIAVSVLTYASAPVGPDNPPYKGMRLYVEDLNGGGHHVDIFSSATVAEFPIGWTAGKLVVAVSSPWCCLAPPNNPYAATSYHVVDPATGDRLSSLCDKSDGPEGPIEPAGAICFTAGAAPKFQRWDGSPFGAPAAVPNPSQYLNALSPDGTRAAVGGQPIRIWGPNGSTTTLRESGYVLGWLDADRVVFGRQDTTKLSVVDLKLGASVDLPVTGGIYLGTFPTALT